jgi:hypothetical protein
MDLETHVVIPVVERALAMSALGREHWCIEWAKWLWAQEIEIAIYQSKLERSWLPAAAHADPLS